MVQNLGIKEEDYDKAGELYYGDLKTKTET